MVHEISLLPGSPCTIVIMAVSRHFVFVAAVLSVLVLCLWILYQGPGVSHIQVQPRTGDEHDENRNGRPGSWG